MLCTEEIQDGARVCTTDTAQSNNITEKNAIFNKCQVLHGRKPEMAQGSVADLEQSIVTLQACEPLTVFLKPVTLQASQPLTVFLKPK